MLHLQSLSRQSSLVEDRIDDSDDDEFQDERAGMCSYCQSRPISFSVAAWHKSHHQPHKNGHIQPDLLKEVLALKALNLMSVDKILYRTRSCDIKPCVPIEDLIDINVQTTKKNAKKCHIAQSCSTQ